MLSFWGKMRKKNPENVPKLTDLRFKRTRNFAAVRSEIKSTGWNKSLCPKKHFNIYCVKLGNASAFLRATM